MRGRLAAENLAPVEWPPSVANVVGFGTMLYGRGGRDRETNSHLATLFVTVLYFPVFALATYRVAKAPDGDWQFLGQGRVSALARLWSLSVVLLALCGIWSLAWISYRGSDGYIARQLLAEAGQLEERGEILSAGRKYGELIQRGAPSEECRLGRRALADLFCRRAKECPGVDQASLLLKAMSCVRERNLREEILRTGGELLETHQREGRPLVAFELLKIVRDRYGKEPADAGLRERILEDCAASPDATLEHFEALAAIMDERGDAARVEALLAPRARGLGARESARMLGMIYSKKGELAKSDAVLTPYVEGRIEAFRKAEKGYADACQRTEKACFRRLNAGEAGENWYERYEASGKKEQQQMVEAYVSSAVRKDKCVAQALAALEKETRIVPFAMDLAVTKLQLAGSAASPAERNSLLAAAEALFLALQGVAGEDESFRIYLGQVKYWLGKSEEGKVLFDLALEQGSRRADLLLTVAKSMRQVGNVEEARALAEEAHGKGTKGEKRLAASLRAAMARDLDDRILWLGRTDSDAPDTRASHASAKAEKALREGEFAEGERLYLEADRIYSAMPLDSATLNNGALVKARLFALTGKAKYLQEQIAMLEKSEALNQTHTVIKSNLASGYFQLLASRMMADRVEYALLRSAPKAEHMALLTRTAREQSAVLKAEGDCSEVKRLRELGERLRLLAPASSDGYATLLGTTHFLRDLALCRSLEAQLRGWQAPQEKEPTEEERAAQRQRGIEINAREAARLREILKRSDAHSPMTQALLRCQLAGLAARTYMLNGQADAAEAVSLAADAYRIHPSLYTELALRKAHLFAALRAVVAASPEAAALWAKCRDELDSDDLCLWMLHAAPGAGDIVLADPDFRKAAEICRQMALREPEEQSVQCWLILSHTHPELAATVAKALAADELGCLQSEVGSLLAPRAAATVAGRILRARMAGKPAEAARLLAEAREHGVHL